MEKKLILNRRQCTKCGEIIISRHVHDYVTCSCGSASVDGGNDYQRYTVDENYPSTDMSVYSDAPFEEIRLVYCRGGRGKDGTEPLKWVPLFEMSNSWVEACIPYNVERGMGFGFANQMYQAELDYRKENKIFIEE